MLSFHRSVAPTKSLADDTFVNNLNLRPEQRDLLVNARTLVRRKLRATFTQATATFSNGERPISPSFFTQGSWGYGTINRPNHVPRQQADMDDGCFMPMSFMRGQSPKRAATWFFGVADAALRELVREQNWKGYINTKPLCCRVIINDEVHIDVPLYAIRDDLFQTMEKATREAGLQFSEAAAVLKEEERPFDWKMVTNEDVLIANRNGQWKPSNPRTVSGWVLSAVDMKGEQLRTIWRAVKAWRDHLYPEGGPSSIALMVMVEADFKDEIASRDDLALQRAARSIRQRVGSPIPAPWDRRGEDLNKLSADERQLVAEQAQRLENEIEECIQGTKNEVDTLLARWAKQCGKFFSKDRARVDEVSPRQVVHAFPAAVAAAPAFRGNNRSA